jgi:glycosyltransferase involved in cell wall biosynthesis
LKNIALIGNSSWSILNFRRNLIIRLLAEGFSIHIIAPKDSASQEIIGLGCIFHHVHMDRRGLNPLKDIKLILTYFLILFKEGIDIALTFNIKPNLYVSYACFFLKTKPIVNISGLGSAFMGKKLLTYVATKLYKIALLGSKTVFFQNKSDYLLFKDLNIHQGDPDNILPGSGVDLDFFSVNNHHLDQDIPIRILFIGRLILDKGIIEFLEAAQDISNKHLNVEFHIYGDVDSYNPSSISQSKVNSFLSDRILCRGNISDIRQALKFAHCVVLPSYREGMSRSLLEAAASGIPIITTDVPGCREIVSDEINGYLCSVKDSCDLACKIEKFLSLTAGQMKIMGSAGRAKIEQEFSVELVVDKYIDRISL